EQRVVRARCLVNAAGPWAASFVEKTLSMPLHQNLRLIKGSHIIVPRLFEGEQAYILQNTDRRIVFAIPYEGAYTLVGLLAHRPAGPPLRSPPGRRWHLQGVPGHCRWRAAGPAPLLPPHRRGRAAPMQTPAGAERPDSSPPPHAASCP